MKVLLIGDYCRDIFIEGTASRLAPEFPVPVFVPTVRRDVPGMAGNVLANLKSLKPDLEVVPIFPETDALKVRHIDARTGHHFLRVDTGGESKPLSNLEMRGRFDECCWDAAIVSDYCKGFLSDYDMERISYNANKALLPWFLDTKRIIGPWANGAILKINQFEMEANLAAGVRPWEHVLACIVTYGAEGMKLYDSHGMIAHEVKGPVVEVRDGAGCGDTVLAALVVAYLENEGDLKAAMDWADKAGRVAVTKRGVVAVKREEVL